MLQWDLCPYIVTFIARKLRDQLNVAKVSTCLLLLHELHEFASLVLCYNARQELYCTLLRGSWL